MRFILTLMKAALCAVVCVFLYSARSNASPPPQPLTVEDTIETTRAMTDRAGKAVLVSPDGRRYAVMLISGDVGSDGVWANILVGHLDSIDVAHPESIARLFTRGLGGGYLRQRGTELLTWPMRNEPRWLDNERIALLWEDDRAVRQVIAIHVKTGQVRYLTQHATDVTYFNVHADGTLLYGATEPCTPRHTEEDYRNGFAVEATSAFELVHGCSVSDRQNSALFVISMEQPEARRITMSGGDAVNHAPPILPAPIFDEQGDRALFPSTVSDIPASWNAYTEGHFRKMLKSRAEPAPGAYGTQFRRLFVIDVEQASARPLWDVPQESYGRMRLAWSPDGASVLLGPTFLPADSADAAGLSGEALAEVDVASGRVWQLPLSAEAARRIQALQWRSPDSVEVTLSNREQIMFHRSGSQWRRAPMKQSEDGRPSQDRASGVRVELRQALNDPPALYAIDPKTHDERLLLELNPDLMRRFSLGRVEWLERDTSDGRHWAGRLYYPADYETARSYPLVIQTHSLAPKDEFSIYGKGAGLPALGPGASLYVAQLLAGRGVFVLHGRVTNHEPGVTLLRKTQIEISATESIVEQLTREGKVERSRVGIMGFSASGWQVAYALTHSDFPYAAAITDDNKDGSYFQAAFGNWLYGLGEEMIGEPPFAEGLNAWLEHSPALNAHRVRTPLLLTVTSPASELSSWAMFSRLRHLRKPVEYYFIPDLAHGTHALQNPRQILALQERALDWWLFWLKGEEDPEPAKIEQYASWRKLRELQARERAARISARGVAAK